MINKKTHVRINTYAKKLLEKISEKSKKNEIQLVSEAVIKAYEAELNKDEIEDLKINIELDDNIYTIGDTYTFEINNCKSIKSEELLAFFMKLLEALDWFQIKINIIKKIAKFNVNIHANQETHNYDFDMGLEPQYNSFTNKNWLSNQLFIFIDDEEKVKDLVEMIDNIKKKIAKKDELILNILSEDKDCFQNLSEILKDF